MMEGRNPNEDKNLDVTAKFWVKGYSTTTGKHYFANNHTQPITNTTYDRPKCFNKIKNLQSYEILLKKETVDGKTGVALQKRLLCAVMHHYETKVLRANHDKRTAKIIQETVKLANETRIPKFCVNDVTKSMQMRQTLQPEFNPPTPPHIPPDSPQYVHTPSSPGDLRSRSSSIKPPMNHSFVPKTSTLASFSEPIASSNPDAVETPSTTEVINQSPNIQQKSALTYVNIKVLPSRESPSPQRTKACRNPKQKAWKKLDVNEVESSSSASESSDEPDVVHSTYSSSYSKASRTPEGLFEKETPVKSRRSRHRDFPKKTSRYERIAQASRKSEVKKTRRKSKESRDSDSSSNKDETQSDSPAPRKKRRSRQFEESPPRMVEEQRRSREKRRSSPNRSRMRMDQSQSPIRTSSRKRSGEATSPTPEQWRQSSKNRSSLGREKMSMSPPAPRRRSKQSFHADSPPMQKKRTSRGREDQSREDSQPSRGYKNQGHAYNESTSPPMQRNRTSRGRELVEESPKGYKKQTERRWTRPSLGRDFPNRSHPRNTRAMSPRSMNRSRDMSPKMGSSNRSLSPRAMSPKSQKHRDLSPRPVHRTRDMSPRQGGNRRGESPLRGPNNRNRPTSPKAYSNRDRDFTDNQRRPGRKEFYNANVERNSYGPENQRSSHGRDFGGPPKSSGLRDFYGNSRNGNGQHNSRERQEPSRRPSDSYNRGPARRSRGRDFPGSRGRDFPTNRGRENSSRESPTFYGPAPNPQPEKEEEKTAEDPINVGQFIELMAPGDNLLLEELDMEAQIKSDSSEPAKKSTSPKPNEKPPSPKPPESTVVSKPKEPEIKRIKIGNFCAPIPRKAPTSPV